MRTEVNMPHLGYDMQEGRIALWLKDVGDHVERGEPLAEVETDKTTIEMEALADGTLVEIVFPAGTDVPVGATIAYLETDG
jgi:pyruvate/2-oxoglutarate dehydrogenase complex dihydrolipoamide acyltransferase (E2) component